MRPVIVSLLAVLLIGVSTSAFAQWTTNGFGVGVEVNSQSGPCIVPDGSGGVILAWEDDRGTSQRDVYVQRLNAAGVPQWMVGGVPLCTAPDDQQEFMIVSDGVGGAIVVWEDFRDDATNRGDVYCRRVNASGVPQWNTTGVPVCVFPEFQGSLAAVSDGAGGIIIAWRDLRNGVDYDVYAQRVNASGVVQWTTNGLPIATENEDQTIPEITSDGAGGAIITWFDRRASDDADVYAQRVNSAGAPVWTPGGISVSSVAGVQRNPFPVPDGTGGAIIAWWDSRNSVNYDIYAQRLTSTGTALWAANGVAVCTATNDQQLPQVVPSGSGGAVIAWEDMRNGVDTDVYAQRLNFQGIAQWTANGVKLCDEPGHQYEVLLTSDGSDGAIATWSDERTGTSNDDIYAQRVTSSGIVPWSADGVALCTADLNQIEGRIASDGAGGAVVVWADNRTDELDVYAQRILSGGTLGIVSGVANRAPSLRAGDVYPNPFSQSAWIDVNLETPATVRVDVFDVAGRLVRAVSMRELAGARRLAFDGRDNAGRLLPSGVYFYRVKAAGETITRKMVIAR